ncbi:hypothetical protein [Euhalothece natronophila]|nr:hypothetical protein [Euhalothece natronophila]
MVRTNVGALLIGVFLIRVWWETRWLKSIKRANSNSRKAQKREQDSTSQ